mmetsp:Transcript_106287/g.216748  ORF Transcript_106287/g.216748 Transcript_106287/m.216748 type:complete len:91 (+) Transcript_106287:1292-1564(+)
MDIRRMQRRYLHKFRLVSFGESPNDVFLLLFRIISTQPYSIQPDQIQSNCLQGILLLLLPCSRKSWDSESLLILAMRTLCMEHGLQNNFV